MFGIRCPHCGSARSKVIDSRKINGGIRRRRVCIDCDARHSTVEVVQTYLRHQKYTAAKIERQTRALKKFQKRKPNGLEALDDAPSPG
jgi:transcriptional regulator NrdR family protein